MNNIAAANGNVYGFHGSNGNDGTALTIMNGVGQEVIRSGADWIGLSSGSHAGAHVGSLDALLIFGPQKDVFLYFLANDTKVDVAYVDDTDGAIDQTNGGHGMYIQDMDNIFICQQACGCGCSG